MIKETAKRTTKDTPTADSWCCSDSIRKENLICQPWQLPNMFVFNPTIAETSTGSVTHIKSPTPTRHIAVYSNYLLDPDEQGAFYHDIEKATGKFRAIYPYVSASITIISYYSLLDARRCLELIETRYYSHHKYRAYYAKPCCINKNMNERFFVILTTSKTISNNDYCFKDNNRSSVRQFNYQRYLSQVGSLYSISELTLHSDCMIINVEYHDERAAERLLRQFDYAVIENIQFRVHTSTVNNDYNCTCYRPIYSPSSTEAQQEWSELDPEIEQPRPPFATGVGTNQPHSYFFFEPFGNANLASSIMGSTSISSRPEPISDTLGEELAEPQQWDKLSVFVENEDVDGENKISLGTTDITTIHASNSSSTHYSSNAIEPQSSDSYSQIVSRTLSDSAEATASSAAVACSSLSTAENVEESEVKNLRINPLPQSSTSTTACTNKLAVTTTTATSMINNMNDVNLDRILNGSDKRTTFMIRNIPNKYTQQMLIDCIDCTHAGTYDFLYLRIDFQNRCNVGYAFINFIDPKSVITFIRERVGKRWKLFNSEKRCALSYANIQGKEALIRKFRNSHVMTEEVAYRPKLFYSSGPNKGKEQGWSSASSSISTAPSSSSIVTAGENCNRKSENSRSTTNVKRDAYYSRRRYSSY